MQDGLAASTWGPSGSDDFTSPAYLAFILSYLLLPDIMCAYCLGPLPSPTCIMHLGLVTAASPAQEEGGRAGPEAHLPVCSSLISSRFAFVLADVYLVVLTVKASTGDEYLLSCRS